MFNFPTSCVEQRSQNRHKPEPAQKISWTSTSKPNQQQLKRDISAAQRLPAFCRRHGQENRSQLTPIPACLSRKRTTLVLGTASCWQPTFSFLQLATEEEVTKFKATKIRASYFNWRAEAIQGSIRPIQKGFPSVLLFRMSKREP